MLTKGDDYPIHQTPDPIAHPGTDRNFYDRFFFCGWSQDGQTYLAAALGVYPNIDIIDGALSVARNGSQTSVFASRILNSERLDTSVGPLRLDIVEPLKMVRVRVGDNDHGLKADFNFITSLSPIEEERHHMRIGPRTAFDLTRMTIFGRYSGWVEVDGNRIELSECSGVRDRSWGVRQIGARDAQPMTSSVDPRTLWMWIPLEFEGVSVLFVNLEGQGRALKRRVEIITESGVEVLNNIRLEAEFDALTRRAKSIKISGSSALYGEVTIEARTVWAFPLVGVGYSHPTWMHGAYHGPLAVHGERRNLTALDPTAAENLHVHAFANASIQFADGRRLSGAGAVEQIVIGDHDYPGLFKHP